MGNRGPRCFLFSTFHFLSRFRCRRAGPGPSPHPPGGPRPGWEAGAGPFAGAGLGKVPSRPRASGAGRVARRVPGPTGPEEHLTLGLGVRAGVTALSAPEGRGPHDDPAPGSSPHLSDCRAGGGGGCTSFCAAQGCVRAPPCPAPSHPVPGSSVFGFRLGIVSPQGGVTLPSSAATQDTAKAVTFVKISCKITSSWCIKS